MIGLEANAAFSFYKSGTFTGCNSTAYSRINHAILLIGWTNTGWIAKNQWGTTWGNGGYIQLDFTNDCGMKYLLGYVNVPSPNSNPQVVMDPKYTGSTTTTFEWYTTFTMSLMLVLLLLAQL